MTVRSKARGKTGRTTLEAAGRWGFAALGVIYLLIGVLALRIAFGQGGRQADRGGALSEVAARPLGSALLWAVGIGLAGMALWRLSEAVWGTKTSHRLLSAGRTVFYAVVAYSALAFAAGDRQERGGGASDRQSQDITAKVLEMPAGQWIVAAAGVAIAVTGVVNAVRAARRTYRSHMRLGRMPEWARRAVDVTGVGGGVARGLVFVAAGVFVVRAAVEYRPSEAKGVDDTLRSFAETPAGPWLLVVIALGLAMYGLFLFAVARWRRV
ncbi:DUF1206 domain-containing protein [Streptomyces sp. SP18CS02]|uniref:DUF1206 domain-containing protein n=1 Tax=Streptomyces sp. SP18CS02 TaxID=3002531 RepID=UPI002E794A94|nr:DUF1206 domain-containing protein [Streptomyces sp. SP18CS02]MEE1757030.1 DUF1206 domain-containing protein [Streptomyces sp. SP18CS02]